MVTQIVTNSNASHVPSLGFVAVVAVRNPCETPEHASMLLVSAGAVNTLPRHVSKVGILVNIPVQVLCLLYPDCCLVVCTVDDCARCTYYRIVVCDESWPLPLS